MVKIYRCSFCGTETLNVRENCPNCAIGDMLPVNDLVALVEGSMVNVATVCKLCGNAIESGHECLIGEFRFCPDCYKVVLKRLDNFWNILTLPEEEFQGWMDDDNY